MSSLTEIEARNQNYLAMEFARAERERKKKNLKENDRPVVGEHGYYF